MAIAIIEQYPDCFTANMKRKTQYLCKCDCGNTFVVSENDLQTVTSCGCDGKIVFPKSIKKVRKRKKKIAVICPFNDGVSCCDNSKCASCSWKRSSNEKEKN
jgi:hypothetical protein